MEKYKKSAYIGINIVIYLALAYVFLRYALGILLPFALSLLIVSISRPIVLKISNHSRVPKSVISLFVTGTILISLVYLLILASGAVLDQIGNIITKISEHLSKEDNYITATLSFIEGLIERFPFLESNISNNTSVYSVALNMATNMVSTLSTQLTQGVGKIIASMPEIIITVVVVILSLFYFSKDYTKITKKLSSLLPSSVRSRLLGIKRDVFFVISSYLRSYLLILLITFAEVFAGLLILGIENAFAIAIIIALVDMLPILGVGTVLIPWSLISLIAGNTSLSIGLVVLFCVVYVVRQFIEPKIVSSQLNVHPLLAIFAMYAGLKIAGIGGMIVAPFLAFVGKTVYDGIKKDNEKQKGVEKENNLC